VGDESGAWALSQVISFVSIARIKTDATHQKIRYCLGMLCWTKGGNGLSYYTSAQSTYVLIFLPWAGHAAALLNELARN
jgi:hypothetical protein